MNDNNILGYLAAFREYKAAVEKMNQLESQVSAAAAEIKLWHSVANKLNRSAVPGFEFQVLPDRSTLCASLEAVVHAYRDVTAAWGELRPEDRSGLQEPSHLA